LLIKYEISADFEAIYFMIL